MLLPRTGKSIIYDAFATLTFAEPPTSRILAEHLNPDSRWPIIEAKVGFGTALRRCDFQRPLDNGNVVNDMDSSDVPRRETGRYQANPLRQGIVAPPGHTAHRTGLAVAAARCDPESFCKGDRRQ